MLDVRLAAHRASTSASGCIVVFAVFYGARHVVDVGGAPHAAAAACRSWRSRIGNLGAPGGLTRSVVLSLGAGLSLLVAVALADASIVQRADGAAADAARPNYFVLDVPKERL